MDSGVISGPSGNAEININASEGLLVATGGFQNASNIVLNFEGGPLFVAVGGGEETPDFSPGGDADSQDFVTDDFAMLAGFVAANPNISLQSQLITFDIRTELQQTGELLLFDLSIFEEELEIIGTIGRGVAMDISQCEELEGCAPFATVEALDAFLTQLDERIAEMKRRLDSGSGDSARIQVLLDGFTEQREYFDTDYRTDLDAYLDEGDDFDDEFDDFEEDEAATMDGAEDRTIADLGFQLQPLAVNAYQWIESMGTLIWTGDIGLPSDFERY
jgi:hypothetical protein